MENSWTQLGAAGLLIFLVIREMFNFLRDRKAKTEPLRIECPNNIEHLASTLLALEDRSARLGDQMEELHRWHRPNDDGRQNWKWPPELDLKFAKMVEGIDQLTRITERLADQAEDQTDSLKTVTAALARAISK